MDQLTPPSSSNNVVLNLSSQAADATATVIELRHIKAEGEHVPDLTFPNANYDKLVSLISPGVVEPRDTQGRIAGVKAVRRGAAWLNALQYVVIIRDIELRGGSTHASVLVYRLEGAELVGSFELTAWTHAKSRQALLTLLAKHFTVFTRLGNRVASEP